MTDAIEMRGVTLRLGQNSFVFDCALPEGAVIGVTGASGAGKTTLLDVLASRKNIGTIHGDKLIGVRMPVYVTLRSRLM